MSDLRAMSAAACYPIGMRSLALTVLAGWLGACGSTGGGECTVDADCGGEVCARDGMCASASSVRRVMVTWTVNGGAANTTSCAAFPNLFLNFLGSDSVDTLGFAPVPCMIGQFVVDKLPNRFSSVELGVENGGSSIKAITSGSATFDVR